MLWPDPWWIDLLALVPVGVFWMARRGLALRPSQWLGLTAWALAFGVVEASVVVYLRAIAVAAGGGSPHLADVVRFSVGPATVPVAMIPEDLLSVERWREVATIVMLAGSALLVARGWRERIAAFLWAFAGWDLAYYGALWVFIGWPASLSTVDVLFLIPRPWIAQVWYPLLISAATWVAIAAGWRRVHAPGRRT